MFGFLLPITHKRWPAKEVTNTAAEKPKIIALFINETEANFIVVVTGRGVSERINERVIAFYSVGYRRGFIMATTNPAFSFELSIPTCPYTSERVSVFIFNILR